MVPNSSSLEDLDLFLLLHLNSFFRKRAHLARIDLLQVRTDYRTTPEVKVEASKRIE